MKIGTVLRIIAVILIFLSVFSALSVFWALGRMTDDGRVVNYSGIVRGGTQRLIKLELGNEPADELIKKLDKIVKGLIDGDAELRLPKAVDGSFIAALKETEKSWQALKASIQSARADRSVQGRLLRESEDYFELTNKMVTTAENISRRKVATSKTVQIMLLALNLGILLPIIFIVQRKLTRPLGELAVNMELIGTGDLQVVVDEGGKDEIGVLSKTMNTMTTSFSATLNGMIALGNNVVATIDVLRSRADAMSSGAKNQSGQASQIAAASEEMSQTIIGISKNATSAAQSAEDAMKVATDGKGVADGAVSTVNKVFTSTVELSTVVDKLNRSAGEIGDIVTVIKGIADQTNLLALNAAIEAARAGEQGRGFAVVADEVRKLAERTIKATAEISDKIGMVQAESEQTAATMAQASGEVTQATQYIKNVGGSLNSIVASVQTVRDQINQIAAAVEEQSAASEEVTNNITRTSGIARDMEKMSGDVMHEVNSLTKIAEELRNSTAGFKTKGGELAILDVAKTDHRVFVGKIASCLNGDIELAPDALPDHHACRFGRWYDGEGKGRCGALPSYQAIAAPHEQIHALARQAVAAHNGGDAKRSKEIYAEIERLSLKVGDLLERIKQECH